METSPQIMPLFPSSPFAAAFRQTLLRMEEEEVQQEKQL